MADSAKETWGSGDAYEQYVGRWSRPVAREFLEWLNIEPGVRWGDVGYAVSDMDDVLRVFRDTFELELSDRRGLKVKPASKLRHFVVGQPW